MAEYTESDWRRSAGRILNEHWWQNYYTTERERTIRKITTADPNNHDALRRHAIKLQLLESMAQDLRRAAHKE
jgi:hypothetical protein